MGGGYDGSERHCEVESNRWAGTLLPPLFFDLKRKCPLQKLMQPGLAMMQAAKPGHPNDFAPGLGVTHRRATGRRFLRQREMSSIVVIIADVLIHQALQMALIENDHMVEQIAAAVANPTLGNAVLPRTSITCPLGLDTKHLHRIDQFLIELRAAIKNQISGAES